MTQRHQRRLLEILMEAGGKYFLIKFHGGTVYYNSYMKFCDFPENKIASYYYDMCICISHVCTYIYLLRLIWHRLVFTTGTVDTQKKTGRINYFPLKAVQSFNTDTMVISNSIYAGDFPLIQFFGEFEWLKKQRKLEFDFDQIALLGFKINLPKGGAAKIGSSTGLGSENNVQMIEKQGKKPFFNWISADEVFGFWPNLAIRPGDTNR